MYCCAQATNEKSRTRHSGTALLVLDPTYRRVQLVDEAVELLAADEFVEDSLGLAGLESFFLLPLPEASGDVCLLQ